MFISFKNSEKTFNAVSLREEQLLMNDSSNVWSLRFIITDNITSDEADKCIKEDNISLITAETEDGALVEFTGYTRIVGISIVFDENTLASRCAVQLQKHISDGQDAEV